MDPDMEAGFPLNIFVTRPPYLWVVACVWLSLALPIDVASAQPIMGACALVRNAP